MREFREEEIKVIEYMVLESMESDSMDINDFLKEMEDEERRRIKSKGTTKLRLKNMLGKITNRFVRI